MSDACKTESIKEWEDVQQLATLLYGEFFEKEYLFRGESRCWPRPLDPTFVRTLRDKFSPVDARTIEREALERFKRRAHLYPEIPQAFTGGALLPESAWWPFMKH